MLSWKKITQKKSILCVLWHVFVLLPHAHIHNKRVGGFIAVIVLFNLMGFGGRIKKFVESDLLAGLSEPHGTVHQIPP